MRCLLTTKIIRIKTRPITGVTIEETTEVTTGVITEEIIVRTNVVVLKGITEATTSATTTHTTKTIDKTGVVDEALGIINTDSNPSVCTVTFATNLDTHPQPVGFENSNVDHQRCPTNN